MSAGMELDESIAVMRRAAHDNRRVRKHLPRSIEHAGRADAQLALLCVKRSAREQDGERREDANHRCTRAVTSIWPICRWACSAA